MELFIKGYNEFIDRGNDCKPASKLCEFNCDKDDIGVYSLSFEDKIIYIGRTYATFERRFNGHLNNLFKYWHKRYHKKLTKVTNYQILLYLTRELVNNKKILVNKLSNNPDDERFLIEKHIPFCNIQNNPVSKSELIIRKKDSINELRQLKTQYNIYSILN